MTTEQDLITYLDQVTAEYAPQFPAIKDFHATHSFFAKQVGFYGYKNESYDTVSAYAPTWAEAAVLLREKIGTPESQAAAKRAAAAKLLEEAAALEGGAPVAT